MTDKQKETPESIMREALERIQCEFGLVITEVNAEYLCTNANMSDKRYRAYRIKVEGEFV